MIILSPLKNEYSNSFSRRSCKLQIHSEKGVTEKLLWFEYPANTALPHELDCDSYLLATIMDAMIAGSDLKIEGSISEKLYSNLEEFQRYWVKVKPELFSLIRICAETIEERKEKAKGFVSAYSGGVDANFTVYAHIKKKYQHANKELKLGSFVHGYDIPLSNDRVFEDSLVQGKMVLSDVGLPLVGVKTNAREISSVDWNYNHGVCLVAALNNLKNDVRGCLVGSSYDYSALNMPWGSSPITDHLLSSEDFTVIHDGASFSRTEKVLLISDWQIAVDNLRVCWVDNFSSTNCGVCEKCLRTKYNFIVNKCNVPNIFKNQSISLANIVLTTESQMKFWKEILVKAKENDISTVQIEKLIKRRKVLNILIPPGSSRRELIKRL
ncbi:TPA: hypothetical protein ACPHT2_004802, partial [Vibrio antiquarius]